MMYTNDVYMYCMFNVIYGMLYVIACTCITVSLWYSMISTKDKEAYQKISGIN